MIDKYVWYLVRLGGLVQASICSLILTIYHPNPCQRDEYDKWDALTNGVFGGMAIYGSKTPEDIPSSVRGSLLFQGKLVAILIIGNILLWFITDLVKMIRG